MTAGRTPEEYRDFFAAAFASMDGRPRRTGVTFKAEGLVIDIDAGNPVFTLGGSRLKADFRGRWLPEHPVPLVYPGPGPYRLRFSPVSGNRVRVR